MKPMNFRQIRLNSFFLISFFFFILFLFIVFSSFSLSAPNQTAISSNPHRRELLFESDSKIHHTLNEEGSFLEEKLFQPLDLDKQKIYCLVIDPGHGGNDYGVFCSAESNSEHSLREKDLTLDIARRLQNLILENTPHRVLLTRTGDYTMSLIDRTTFANHHKADLFLSIHFNAHFDFALKEFQIYICSYSNEELERFSADKWNWKATQCIYLADSRDFAINIEKAALKNNIFESIKLLEMPFYILKGAHMPAVLVEAAFFTNPESMEKLRLEEYRHYIATVLYQGIISYFQNKEAHDDVSRN